MIANLINMIHVMNRFLLFFKILSHANIWTLQKNFDNLCNFLSKLPSKPHVISISETKIKDKPLLNVSIPGYTFLHNNSLSNAGGVGVYVADIFQLEELTFKVYGCENIRYTAVKIYGSR